MNKVAQVFSEVDVLETEIQRKADELDRLQRRLARLRGDAAPRRTPAGGGEVPSGLVDGEVIKLAELERRYVLQVLDKFHGNRTHTARALGIGTNTLWRKLKAWGQPPARG